MRLDEDGNAYKVDFVSIHASVKDATCSAVPVSLTFIVSIHASVKDATVSASVFAYAAPCFNPRICKRCDLGVAKYTK